MEDNSKTEISSIQELLDMGIDAYRVHAIHFIMNWLDVDNKQLLHPCLFDMVRLLADYIKEQHQTKE